MSCTVYLEKKPFSQLLVHDSCGCHLCPNCLEMTNKYYSKDEKTFTCPTCSQLIVREDFVALSSPKISSRDSSNSYILVIPLYFRVADSWNSSNNKLISTPVLLQLPSVLNSGKLYSTVDRYVPYLCPYSLYYVDNKVSLKFESKC